MGVSFIEKLCGRKATDIQIEVDVPLLQIRYASFPDLCIKMQPFKLEPYFLGNALALCTVLHKKQIKVVLLPHRL